MHNGQIITMKDIEYTIIFILSNFAIYLASAKSSTHLFYSLQQYRYLYNVHKYILPFYKLLSLNMIYLLIM